MSRLFAVSAIVASAASLCAGAQHAPANPTLTFGYTRLDLPLDEAFAINESGAVAGRVGGHAAMYSRGQVVILPDAEPLYIGGVAVPYRNHVAVDIADNGYIVGNSTFMGFKHALFWASPTATPLDIGFLGDHMVATSVNVHGVVVGYYYSNGFAWRAFRWSLAEGLRDISSTSLQQALDVSSTGYIAGGDISNMIVLRWDPSGSVTTLPQFPFLDLARRALANGSVFSHDTLWTLDGSSYNISPAASHEVTQINATTTRKVGYWDPWPADRPFRPWTTINAGAVFYLPVPADAEGLAIDVNTCGTILGKVHDFANSTARPVIWSKRFCDVLPILTR